MTQPFTLIQCEQRSPEWHAARLGRLTGSNAAKAIDFKQKGGETEKRKNLRAALVAERLTRVSVDDTYVTRAMERGIALEAAAFEAYEINRGQAVHRSGFLFHKTLMAGCSLDGRVGDFEGILELKCPTPTVHLSYLRGGVVPDEHWPQCLHNLWISGAGWCDFVSYDDRFPDGLQFFCVRMERETVAPFLEKYIAGAEQFLREVEAELVDVLSRVAVA